jgi:hypothetical protein
MKPRTSVEGWTEEADEIVAAIRPLLAGRPPAVQGLVVVELAATWIAGHAEDIRAQILEMELQSIRELVPVIAAQLWEREPKS